MAKFIIYAILIFYFILVIIRNNHKVSVDLLFQKFDVSLFLLIILSIIIGILIAVISLVKTNFTLKKEIKDLKKP